ncbi:MAG: cyclase family protein [Wenzhouxiangella sp.]
MIARFHFAGAERRVDLGAGTSLAIPIDRDGQHPRFFVDRQVRFEPLAIGNFTGRVATGGSCNAEIITFIPHCHGTHTEGAGHITGTAEAVQETLAPGLISAALISVTPTHEHVETSVGTGPVITAAAMDWPEGVQALIIRTLPNDPAKCRLDYAASPPYPLLSAEAMAKLVEAGIEHLLIDTPSVDAADDSGRLRQHRSFWGMGTGDERPAERRAACTITEMIYAPNELTDGLFLLSLGVSALRGDASPSAPVVFRMQ